MSKQHFTVALNRLAYLCRSNQLAEARALGRRLGELEPNSSAVLSMLGTVHGRLGEYSAAESCYRNLVHLEPQSFQHYYYLGLALVMQGELEEALPPFTRMLQLRSDFAEGHMQTGCLLRDLGNHEGAINHLRRALELSPALSGAAVLLANLLVYQGRLEEALDLYDQALRDMPCDPDALAGKSSVLERQGQRAAAWECLAPIVAVNTLTPAVAIMYAKLTPEHGCTDHAKLLLNEILTRGSLATSQKQEIHFALGRLYDKMGDYETAFMHYHSANSLNPHRFDTARIHSNNERIIEIFSGKNLPCVDGALSDSPTLIFIVGMPRSGSSLIEQILASHPDVAAGGELEALARVELSAAGILGSAEDYPECLNDATLSGMSALAELYLDEVAAISRGARFVTDKLPVNYLRLGLIEKLFPDAIIVHATRNPYDTCLSCYFQNFSNTHTYSSSLEALGYVYSAYEKLMAFWRMSLSIDILDVSYEAMVNDTDHTIRALLEFCNLPWDDRCLEHFQSKRYINTASYNQVRQPVYTTSVGRWKLYEAHLSELIEVLP